MTPTLYLSGQEQAVLQSLAGELADAWTIVPETAEIIEDHDRMRVRLSLLKIHDSDLTDLRSRILAASSDDERQAILERVDLSQLQDEDLLEIFFAMGAVALTSVIASALGRAVSREVLSAIAALTVMRRALLETRTSQPSA